MDQKCSIDIFNRCVPYFEMLKDNQRQELVINLAKYKELSVTELVEKSSLSMPAVSHHLKLLTQSGLVVSKKIGTRRFYRLYLDDALEVLEEFIESLKFLSLNKEN